MLPDAKNAFHQSKTFVGSFHAMSDWFSVPSCTCTARVELVDQTVDEDNLNRVEALAMCLVANAHLLCSRIQKR